MAGSEARNRRLKFKEYQRIYFAEQFARKLGVREVDYRGRLDIANVCNHGLFLVFTRGVPMPSRLVVKEWFTREEAEDPNEIGYYSAGFGNQPGEIYLNEEHPAWRNLAATMQQARANHNLSTADPRHPIVHEMGELAMHLSVGGSVRPLPRIVLRDEVEFQRLGETGELDEIADVVSDRASLNHSEFVAEVFAALMSGRIELLENEAVMSAYRHFGGAPPAVRSAGVR